MKLPTSSLHFLLFVLVWGWGMAAQAQEALLGARVDSLLEYARTHNPEYATMLTFPRNS